MHKTDRSFYIVSGITAVICAAVFIASRFIPDQVEEKSLKPHIISVLDLDSPRVGRFTEADREGLEEFVEILQAEVWGEL